MGLPASTLAKLLREHVRDGPPLIVAPATRKRLGKQILKRLERFEWVAEATDSPPPDVEGERLVCVFSIQAPAGGHDSAKASFLLMVGDHRELTIHSYQGEATVAHLEELEAFVGAWLKQMRRHQANTAKRRKVQEFKTQVVAARMGKLAREFNFSFVVGSYPERIELIIRLDGNQVVQFDIPYDQFDEAVPQLHAAIAAFHELSQAGSRFKTFGKLSWEWRYLSSRQAD